MLLSLIPICSPARVAKPFDVSSGYAQLIYDQTSSPRLHKVLKWEQENWASSEQRQMLAYIMLVELLVYQFVYPVRWVKTQDMAILPVFDPLKARHFDVSWNWVQQHALLVYYDIIFGRLTTLDHEITTYCIAYLNQADPEMLTYMQYNIDHCDPTKGENYKLAKEFGHQLFNKTREVTGQRPMYKDGMFNHFLDILSLLIYYLYSHVPYGAPHGSY
jgi:hypothetical protein